MIFKNFVVHPVPLRNTHSRVRHADHPHSLERDIRLGSVRAHGKSAARLAGHGGSFADDFLARRGHSEAEVTGLRPAPGATLRQLLFYFLY